MAAINGSHELHVDCDKKRKQHCSTTHEAESRAAGLEADRV